MSDPLLNLIEEYYEAAAVVNSIREDVQEDDPREQPFWNAYNRLCENPPRPTTPAGALAGIRYVRDEGRDCGSHPDLTVNVLTAVLAYLKGAAEGEAT